MVGGQIQYPLREAAAVSLSVSIFAAILMHRNGAYCGSGGLLQIRETERAIRIPVQSLLAMLPLSIVLNLTFARGAFLVALVLVPGLLILQKHVFVAGLRRLHASGRGMDRAIVYGIGNTGKRILSALSYSVRLGVHPIAVVVENAAFAGKQMAEMGYRHRRSVPVQRGPITSALLSSCRCNMLVVALPNLFPGANRHCRGCSKAGRIAGRLSLRYRTRGTALDRVDRRRWGIAYANASAI